MFTDVGKIIKNKQKTGFAQSPAQAAFICEQAKIATQTLLDKNIEELSYKFKRGTLYISAPHALMPELNMHLVEIQKILDHRVGKGKIRTIKVRTV